MRRQGLSKIAHSSNCNVQVISALVRPGPKAACSHTRRKPAPRRSAAWTPFAPAGSRSTIRRQHRRDRRAARGDGEAQQFGATPPLLGEPEVRLLQSGPAGMVDGLMAVPRGALPVVAGADVFGIVGPGSPTPGVATPPAAAGPVEGPAAAPLSAANGVAKLPARKALVRDVVSNLQFIISTPDLFWAPLPYNAGRCSRFIA
jgi:hypothetical protein